MARISGVLVGVLLSFCSILVYQEYLIQANNRYTVKDKEYVEGCSRVQEARAKMGMDMEKFWDQGCKRVLKMVD